MSRLPLPSTSPLPRRVGFALLGAVLALAAATGLAQDEAAPAAPAAPAAADPEAEGDAALAQRTLKGYELAVTKFDEALKKKPDDVGLKLKLVTALNSVMRVKTKANTPTVSGTLDTPANKKIWSDLGTRSEKLGKEVLAAKPKDLDAALQYAEAYMYKSSSFGIVKAIMSGAADQYKENANRLIELDKKADDAVGYLYLGAFYMVAPWPVADADESEKFLDMALQIAPKSVRNNYYVGLRALKDEKWDKAEKHLKYAAETRCTNPSEKDYCPFIKQQAKLGLETVAKER